MAQQIDAGFARQFLGRLHGAVNAYDADAVATLCCEDVVWEDPAAPEALRGREAVHRFHRARACRQTGAVPRSGSLAEGIGIRSSASVLAGHEDGEGEGLSTRARARYDVDHPRG